MIDFERLFTYNDWSHHEELAHLLGTKSRDALRLFAHIVGTEATWLARIRGTDSPLPVWPELSIADCEEHVERLRDAWRELLANRDELPSRITYTNSKGESFTSRLDDIVMHVILHAAYHRGQIARAVRETGESPAYTDYIHCTRNGLID